jgi:secreted PhoX family phosphatase
MPSPVTSPERRTLLKGSAALMAAGATGSISALYVRQAEAQAAGAPQQLAPVPGPYGALRPVNDQATGLPLLMLPEGFSYRSFGWTGDRMDDGGVVPDRHDGMAVVSPRGFAASAGVFGAFGGFWDRVSERIPLLLIRNHERGAAEPINAPGTWDRGIIPGAGTYARAGGGTTTMRVRNGRLERCEASLGGTLVNCAGGPTPWGSWLSCEEIRTDLVSSEGKKHGYVFEVNANAERTTGQPIVAMGRFSHEAVAIDPRTGYVYLTEDDRNKAGFYRFIPNVRLPAAGMLERGGRLQAARVKGRPNADLITANIGDRYEIEWVDIADPDANTRSAAGLPDVSSGDFTSGPFAQAWERGALRMSRGEGIWYADGKLFIVDTSTGLDSQGRKGRGEGAVWVLDIARSELSALFVSGNQLAANNPDNITISPRGGVVLCEDGGSSPDALGPGSRLLGLTRQGEAYYLAKNNVLLDAQQIANAGKNIPAGDYTSSEFCGACWDPTGRWLFVNLQTPGITLAITGPWWRGNL